MRTRSTRLFIVLLHLLGVSNNSPKNSGMIGVNPMAVVLERIGLSQYDGLDGLMKEAEKLGEDELILSEPFWLQDDTDGRCLGPNGFSDCGDATLWLVRRKPKESDRKRFQFFRFDDGQMKDWGYALQLIERLPASSASQTDADCLVPRKRRRRNQLTLQNCESAVAERVWSWRVNAKGELYREIPSAKRSGRATDERKARQCVFRNETSVVLSSCVSLSSAPSTFRKVFFTMLRHQPASTVSKLLSENNRKTKPVNSTEQANPIAAQEPDAADASNTTDDKPHILSSQRDLAHSHASDPVKRATMTTTTAKKIRVGLGVAPAEKKPAKPQRVLFAALKDTNPILFLGETGDNDDDDDAVTPGTPREEGPDKSMYAHTTSKNDPSYKLRRMQLHPYLAAAKDEVWTDPQTGLQFPTDICKYLGHDRKQAGRHTITGLGYYTKTVLAIKVYGVALYVSKRDVLADPIFETFADMTAEELRERKDFYTHLRQMPSTLDGSAGLFDRTLFLKLNMQLSTETMRSSLQATWKLLTSERKELLINSSMKPRPANEEMLETITSPDNPSRCSCGQTAPPEYKADMSCCARGTELVFTWRKNGDLEIRVDGRIMDIFPRPDVATGIFYEYLRTDDPIAPDFTEHVVEGFPFLLGPMAQVKGVSQQMHQAEAAAAASLGKAGAGRRFGRAVGNFADMMTSQASGVAGLIQATASGAAMNVASAARAIGDSARSVSQEVDKRRDQVWTHLSENGKQFIERRVAVRRPDALQSSVEFWMKRRRWTHQDGKKYLPHGRMFRSTVSEWLGEEEEGADKSIPAKMNALQQLSKILFVLLVHFYLLMLLIVSLPASHSSKHVAKASAFPESEDEASTESSSADEAPPSPRRRDVDSAWMLVHSRELLVRRMTPADDEPSQGIRKSLSYYL